MLIKFKDFPLIIASFFIAVFIAPIAVVFVILPLAIYRKIVIFFATFKQNLYAPLNISSCMTAVDNIYTRPWGTINLVEYLNGGHKFADLLSRADKLVEKHPELSCTLTRWMSTYFWKRCPTFKLLDHVILNTESDPEKVQEFLNFITETPFVKGMPLWQIISLPNYYNAEHGTQSAIVIRVHHALADGYALIQIIQDLEDKDLDTKNGIEKHAEKLAKNYRMSWLKRLLYLLELLLITPTESIYYNWKAFNANPLALTPNEKSGEVLRADTLIDLNYLKQISKKIGINMTSIVYAGVAAAVGETIKAKGGTEEQQYSTAYVLPRPGHPRTMTNYVTMAPMTYIISKGQSCRYLSQISDEFQHLLHSPLMLGITAIFNGHCLVSVALGKPIYFEHYGTYLHSNVAYFGDPLKMFENVVKRISIIHGLQQGVMSIFVVTWSYNGKLKLSIAADKKLFPDVESLQKFLSLVKEEFHEMDMHYSVDKKMK